MLQAEFRRNGAERIPDGAGEEDDGGQIAILDRRAKFAQQGGVGVGSEQCVVEIGQRHAGEGEPAMGCVARERAGDAAHDGNQRTTHLAAHRIHTRHHQTFLSRYGR